MSCTGSKPVLTYVVLVILIALWAVVLVPPYLKDRRANQRTFGSLPSSRATTARFGALPPASSVVRTGVRPTSMQGPAVEPVASGSAVSMLGGQGNVVRLRALDDATPVPIAAPVRPVEGAAPAAARLGPPQSTASARERRRHVLMGLTGAAFLTLLMALSFGGLWIAAHVAIDAALLGYVILLVRFRQVADERRSKVAPIRPPLHERPVMSLQAAPDYLVGVRRTGS